MPLRSEPAEAAVTREIAYNLSPYQIEQLGLTESIKTMVEKVAGVSGIQFAMDADDCDGLLRKDLEINVYRAVQECMSNVVKHSQASQAKISLKKRDHALEIFVHDDGKGFDPPAVTGGSRTAKGFGLTGLAERVKLLSGTLAITSSPGRGTTVLIKIPMGDDTLA